MKLVSFASAGQNSYGVVVADGVIDIGKRLGARCPTLRSAIAKNALNEIEKLARSEKADVPLADVALLPPITDPDKIICIGRNYKAHTAEAGMKVPEHPSVFLRLTNTLAAHGAPMIRPKVSGDMDYEGELAVIIGRSGRHIAKTNALDHIAGYSCFNDGSIRDYQLGHSLAVGKNFFATGGFGPWMITADEIPDPGKLALSSRLNGQEVQHGNTSDLIFDVPFLVSYLSAFTPLIAGDVIATGTPEGVGLFRKPPLWMKPGDVIEVEIEGIGTLRNPIEAEQ